MKHRKFLIALLAVPVFLLNSCDGLPWGCITGNDRIAREERIIGSFSNITSYGSFVVNVETGRDYSLTVETDENLLPYIKTSIQGNTLIIETRNNRCLKSNEPIIIDVVTRNIEKIKLAGSGVINTSSFTADDLQLEVSGSGIIDCDRISIDYLWAKISGSGIIELSGTTKTTDYIISGSGLLRAINLTTQRCFADISGSGNIYTHVTDELDVTISGSGSCYYEGDPSIESTITGSGNIRHY